MDYSFTQIAVDRVNAADGQYDVMFIGTGDDLLFVFSVKPLHFMTKRMKQNKKILNLLFQTKGQF